MYIMLNAFLFIRIMLSAIYLSHRPPAVGEAGDIVTDEPGI